MRPAFLCTFIMAIASFGCGDSGKPATATNNPGPSANVEAQRASQACPDPISLEAPAGMSLIATPQLVDGVQGVYRLRKFQVYQYWAISSGGAAAIAFESERLGNLASGSGDDAQRTELRCSYASPSLSFTSSMYSSIALDRASGTAKDKWTVRFGLGGQGQPPVGKREASSQQFSGTNSGQLPPGTQLIIRPYRGLNGDLHLAAKVDAPVSVSGATVRVVVTMAATFEFDPAGTLATSLVDTGDSIRGDAENVTGAMVSALAAGLNAAEFSGF
jgi:hypothetical protein